MTLVDRESQEGVGASLAKEVILVVLVDPTQRVRVLHVAWARMGFPAAPEGPLTLSTFIHEDDLADVVAKLELLVAEPVVAFEARLRTGGPAGRERHLRFRAIIDEISGHVCLVGLEPPS